MWAFQGWFLKRDDLTSGPLSPEEIGRLLADRRLRLTNRLWERWEEDGESVLCPALVLTAVGSGPASSASGPSTDEAA